MTDKFLIKGGFSLSGEVKSPDIKIRLAQMPRLPGALSGVPGRPFNNY